MPHRLDPLINQLFTEEAVRAHVRAWVAKLDRDGVGDRAEALIREGARPSQAGRHADDAGAAARISGGLREDDQPPRSQHRFMGSTTPPSQAPELLSRPDTERHSDWIALWPPEGALRPSMPLWTRWATRWRARFADLSYSEQTPEALGALHKAEIEKWWPIIKEIGIKAE